MTHSDPPQPLAEPPPLPAWYPGSSGHLRRWLAACLLLAALGVFILLLRESALPTGPVSTRDDACPASSETLAQSCPLPQAASDPGEAFPAMAEAQVDWVLYHHRPAMVLFYSQVCRPCMMMEALVQMVRHDYEPAVTFIEVASDAPANAALVRRMGVGTIPASFFVMPSGDIKHIAGTIKQPDLRAELARLAAAGPTVLPTPTAPGEP